MSNLMHDHAHDEEYAGIGDVVQPGDVHDIRPIPRVTIQAFCESEVIAQTLEMAARDRRMARAHVKVHMGGIPAAVDFYNTAPTPNLIVVESKASGRELLVHLGKLAEVCDSETKVVIIGHHNDITLYRELINNGVSEYLVAPVSMADIMGAISNIFINPENGPLGKVFAFIGAKGGVGSSTICHNVAWSIASRFNNDVVLTDLDLAFGTANINLDQDPPQGVADAVFSPERIDDILLDRLLAKCAEHLSLLAAPSTLERTYDFDKNAFNSILEVAQRGSPCVAVDLPHMWSGWTRQILASADEVVITAAPELANLRNAKNLIDTLKELRPNDAKPRLVMNQVGMPKRPEIGVADFTNALGIDPAAVIQFEPALFGSASNNGQMIGEADPKSNVTESFEFLAQVLTGKAQLRTEKKGALNILSKIRRKK
ncbi:MAG: CpaE family protein [Rhizobiaceae bacterium]